MSPGGPSCQFSSCIIHTFVPVYNLNTNLSEMFIILSVVCSCTWIYFSLCRLHAALKMYQRRLGSTLRQILCFGNYAIHNHQHKTLSKACLRARPLSVCIRNLSYSLRRCLCTSSKLYSEQSAKTKDLSSVSDTERSSSVLKPEQFANTEESQDESPTDFKCIYSFKQIISLRILLRLQYLLVPYSWTAVALMENFTYLPWVAAITTTLVAIPTFLFIPRCVLMMSVGKTKGVVDTVKVSTLSYVGGRKDTFYKIEEIVPLSELHVSKKDVYIPFCVYGEKRRRYLLLREVEWDDPNMFRVIMGNFPEDKNWILYILLIKYANLLNCILCVVCAFVGLSFFNFECVSVLPSLVVYLCN